MYEPPLLDFYDNAILSNGDPRAATPSRVAGDGAGRAGVPDQPGERCRRASCCRARASPPSIADFETQSAWLTNVQLERALTSDISVAVGYVNSIGRNLPVLMDVNLVPTGQTLADGRPIYSTAVSARRASTRRSTTSTCSSRSASRPTTRSPRR